MGIGQLKIGGTVNIGANFSTIFNHFDFKVIQVMLTDPRYYDFPDTRLTTKYLHYYRKYSKEPLYVHCPFLVSLVKDIGERQCRFTRNYAGVLASIAEHSEVPIRFVTHLGVIPPEMSYGVAYTNIMKNLIQIYHKIKIHKGDFKVLLENDSGTYNRIKMNTAHGLSVIFNSNKIAEWFTNIGWLGICFDTNHAYGSGFNRKLWLDFVEISDVIHFNPIPDFMVLGRCQDKHTDHRLKNSKEKKLLRAVALKARRLSIPLILETRFDLLQENSNVIRSWA